MAAVGGEYSLAPVSSARNAQLVGYPGPVVAQAAEETSDSRTSLCSLDLGRTVMTRVCRRS